MKETLKSKKRRKKRLGRSETINFDLIRKAEIHD
jgi:hypothetical protein